MNFLYNALIDGLPVRVKAEGDQLYILNENEQKLLKRNYIRALCFSAIFSVIGFLLYYLPTYYLKSWFPVVDLPWLGLVAFPWGEYLWGILLMIIEIYLLVLLNIYAVHEIAVITGYISAENKKQKKKELLNIGTEVVDPTIQKYGIDPFQGLDKRKLFVYNTLFKLKGFIGNKLLQYLIKRLLGRYAVREIIDFIGMPLYMFINAYSTHKVLTEAKLVIMGCNLIEAFVKNLPQIELTEGNKELIYDTLQLISMSKRDYHQNHYLLTKQVFEHYAIDPKTYHFFSEDYLAKLATSDAQIRLLCEKILIMGFVLDGYLSQVEKKSIQKMNEQGVLNATITQLEHYAQQFRNGEGIDLIHNGHA